jgi:uncharacterized membrane protein
MDSLTTFCVDGPFPIFSNVYKIITGEDGSLPVVDYHYRGLCRFCYFGGVTVYLGSLLPDWRHNNQCGGRVTHLILLFPTFTEILPPSKKLGNFLRFAEGLYSIPINMAYSGYQIAGIVILVIAILLIIAGVVLVAIDQSNNRTSEWWVYAILVIGFIGLIIGIALFFIPRPKTSLEKRMEAVGSLPPTTPRACPARQPTATIYTGLPQPAAGPRTVTVSNDVLQALSPAEIEKLAEEGIAVRTPYSAVSKYISPIERDELIGRGVMGGAPPVGLIRPPQPSPGLAPAAGAGGGIMPSGAPELAGATPVTTTAAGTYYRTSNGQLLLCRQ